MGIKQESQIERESDAEKRTSNLKKAIECLQDYARYGHVEECVELKLAELLFNDGKFTLCKQHILNCEINNPYNVYNQLIINRFDRVLQLQNFKIIRQMIIDEEPQNLKSKLGLLLSNPHLRQNYQQKGDAIFSDFFNLKNFEKRATAYYFRSLIVRSNENISNQQRETEVKKLAKKACKVNRKKENKIFFKNHKDEMKAQGKNFCSYIDSLN